MLEDRQEREIVQPASSRAHSIPPTAVDPVIAEVLAAVSKRAAALNKEDAEELSGYLQSQAIQPDGASLRQGLHTLGNLVGTEFSSPAVHVINDSLPDFNKLTDAQLYQLFKTLNEALSHAALDPNSPALFANTPFAGMTPADLSKLSLEELSGSLQNLANNPKGAVFHPQFKAVLDRTLAEKVRVAYRKSEEAMGVILKPLPILHAMLADEERAILQDSATSWGQARERLAAWTPKIIRNWSGDYLRTAEEREIRLAQLRIDQAECLEISAKWIQLGASVERMIQDPQLFDQATNEIGSRAERLIQRYLPVLPQQALQFLEGAKKED